MIELSIIIVTYNSEKHIFECLDSIYKYNDIGNDLEIIIVDNCSNDQERVFEKIKLNYPNDIILIKSPMNGGYGYGNNQGVKRASANRFIVMNPDVRLVKPIFSDILHRLDLNPDIGMMGVSFVDGSHSRFLKPEYSTLCNMILEDLICRFNLISIKKMFFSGSFLIFDKKIFIDAGMFDENIFLYHEEADLSNRILALGKNVVLDNNISVMHLAHGREVNPYLLNVGAESRDYYFRKYHANIVSYYKNKLLWYKFKYFLAVLLHNDLKKNEFASWIKLCKNKGSI